MQARSLVDPVHYERMTGEELRAAFLVEDLFAPDEVRLVHWEAERTILGSVVPRRRPLALDAPAELAAPFFAARRELGVVNLGGPGSVTVSTLARARARLPLPAAVRKSPASSTS
jgi:4-deoxy-L-threo-5-hexosulose-uronate ketol-isomerase